MITTTGACCRAAMAWAYRRSAEMIAAVEGGPQTPAILNTIHNGPSLALEIVVHEMHEAEGGTWGTKVAQWRVILIKVIGALRDHNNKTTRGGD